MSEDSRHQSCTQPATVLDPPMFGEIERVIRRRGERMGAKHGGQFYLAAADAIRDLRVALASQIEISNDLRGQLESRHQVGRHHGDHASGVRHLIAGDPNPQCYPNLSAMLAGCVSGPASEWPAMRAELRELCDALEATQERYELLLDSRTVAGRNDAQG